MKKVDPKKKIILDADVVIHFCKGEQLGMLPKIFPNKMFIPDIVYRESLSRDNRIQVNNLISFKLVTELEIKAEINVLKEYKRLVNTLRLGKGESICLAYCKYHNDVIASSNLLDIKQYCQENSIEYITTMEFLAEAYRTGKMSESDCDYFIFKVKSKNSHLPCNSIEEFLKNENRS